VAVQLQQLRQQGLLKKLCSHPQLLCVDVERQVGNLYEIGALLQEQVSDGDESSTPRMQRPVLQHTLQ